MRIGYSVEGSTDRALLNGLQQRWCPAATLVEGRFRGTSGISQTREIPNTCIELQSKGADMIVFLRDANNEPWRDVLKAEHTRCRSDHQHLTIFGVCDRNIECWISADADWIGERTGRPAAEFRIPDPKNAFNAAMRITGFDRRELEISKLVAEAPLRNWLSNQSFESFYEALRSFAKLNNCDLENLREN